MEQYGLLGYPLGHSFSRNYFMKKFQEENIDAEYVNFELEDINDIKGIIEKSGNLKGFNVTLPYKTDVIRFLTEEPLEIKEIGAVNCVKVIHNGNRTELIGYNTDALGFDKSLSSFLQTSVDKALILGSGGASKAVRYVLGKKGIDFRIVSRNPKNGNDISYKDVADYIDSCRLIVNATPLGMWPNCENAPDIPYDRLTPEHYLFDLTYNPETTEFMKRGNRRGAHTKNGYEMLVGQAEAAWAIWNS